MEQKGLGDRITLLCGVCGNKVSIAGDMGWKYRKNKGWYNKITKQLIRPNRVLALARNVGGILTVRCREHYEPKQKNKPQSSYEIIGECEKRYW